MLDIISFVIVVILFFRIIDMNRRIKDIENKLRQKKQLPVSSANESENETPEIINNPRMPIEKIPNQIEKRPLHAYHRQKSSTPTFVEMLFRTVIHYFSIGNVIAKVGAVVLFFGMIFLLKYVSARGLFPIDLRMIFSAILALLILGFGWFIRNKKQEYGLILQGCGIGILFIVIFISYKLYSLLPSELAFILLILITVLSAILALQQNSKTLMIIAQIGGLLTPILAAGKNGNEIIFFSYYLILNFGIALVSWFKMWRPLNIIGFIFTFGVSVLWGLWQYKPDQYVAVQIFLALFIVLYSIISLAFSHNAKRFNIKNYVDTILTFGVPFSGFLLQVTLVDHFEYGIAISAIIFAAFYVMLSWIGYLLNSRRFKLFCETNLYIACGFILLSILFGISREWVGLIWSLGMLGMLHFGLKTDKLVTKVFALVVLTLALFFNFIFFLLQDTEHLSIIGFINPALVGIGGIIASILLRKNQLTTDFERIIAAPGLFILGFLLWFHASFSYFYTIHHIMYGLGYFALFNLLWLHLGKKQQLNYLYWLASSLVVLNIVYLVLFEKTVTSITLPLFITWVFAFIVQYWTLYKIENSDLTENWLQSLHACTTASLLWFSITFIGHGLYYNLHLPAAWQVAAMGLVPLLVIMIIHGSCQFNYWPFRRHQVLYSQIINSVIIAAVYLWTLLTNLLLWKLPQTLTYLPLLNPVDLMMAFSLLIMIFWLYRYQDFLKTIIHSNYKWLLAMLGAWCFVWLTVMVFRCVHYWLNIPYTIDGMLNSTMAQTALSIVWSSVGLITILVSTLKGVKFAWYMGLSLIIMVSAKLFFIDLANTDSLGRIISFIGVGIILLIIGYFSPAIRSQKNIESKL